MLGRAELLEKLSYEFCRRQHRENIIYSEVRYGPQVFVSPRKTSSIHSLKEALECILMGLERGQNDFGITVRSILCCFDLSSDLSEDLVELAIQFKGRGVIGVDISAGKLLILYKYC